MRLWILGIALIFGATWVFAQSSTQAKKIQGQIKSVESKQSKERQKLKAVRSEIREVKDEIDHVDDRLDAIEQRYQRTQDRLGANRNETVRLTRELAEAEKELESKSAMARERLRYIRMRGGVSVLTAMVGSKSLGDLASRKVVVEKVAEKDRKLFEDVKRLRDGIRVRKGRAEVLGRELRQLLMDQRQQHAEANEIRREKRVELAKLADRAEDLARTIRQLDREEEDLRAKLESFAYGVGGSRPGRLLQPVRGRIGSGFGMRRHPILRTTRMHWGLDIAAPTGTPIRAAAAGTVVYASRQRGYGNVIIVQHAGGMTTLYAHCSSFVARMGQRVARGQVIARVGSTGLSTGPHLHFEVAINGRRVNPRGYL